jgi:hypothetical protein
MEVVYLVLVCSPLLLLLLLLLLLPPLATQRRGIDAKLFTSAGFFLLL